MTAKAPFTFTGVSYVIDKSGDGSVRHREEFVFEQVPSPKGTYQFQSTQRTVRMPEEERLACDKKMMKHAGDILSNDFASQAETGQREE